MDSEQLAFAGATRQAELIATGEVGSRELVEAHLERIARLDPALRAFRVVFAERALAEADQADARRASDQRRPLLGVPVAIKDDVDVAGEITALGSNAFGDPAAADAEVVRRLRAAGAIVVGKTSVPELTQWPLTESAAWGVTRNPWDLQRTPGGSSGGSGAAVAAGLVPLAHGSDGAGSIRIPAACCGLFGIKPQRGRVPTAPQIDPWRGLTVYGPLARSVADAALFLDVTADGAPDGGGFRAAAASEPAERLRIALSTKMPPGTLARLHPEAHLATESMAEALRSLGHEVVEQEVDYGPLLGHVLPAYFGGIADEARSMAHPERLERRTRNMARLGVAMAPLARWSRSHADEYAARVNAIFDSCDAVLTPALSEPPLEVGTLEGRGALWSFNRAAMFTPYAALWNVVGNPAVSVPAGSTAAGLPLAVQIVGRPHGEAALLSLAAQIEAARPWADRIPPQAAVSVAAVADAARA